MGGRILVKYGSPLRILHANNLGTTTVTTDQTGAELEDERFYPWGQDWTRAGQPYVMHFAGMQGFEDPGLVYPTDFRKYNPALGRWMTPDPLGGDVTNPQSLNRYAYALNDLVSNTDPSGLSCIHLQDGTTVDNLDGKGCSEMDNTPDQVNVSSNGPGPVDTSSLDHLASLSSIGGTSPGGGGGASAGDDVSKHYESTTPCSSAASQVMGTVESNFPRFGNYSRWGGLESVTFSPPSDMGPGSTIPISVNVLGFTKNLSVKVQSMNSQSMTFTTLPGHLLYPASITFAASPASPGSINFNINLRGTVANKTEFRFGGSNFEDAQWNHFLDKVGGFCKGGG